MTRIELISLTGAKIIKEAPNVGRAITIAKDEMKRHGRQLRSVRVINGNGRHIARWDAKITWKEVVNYIDGS